MHIASKTFANCRFLILAVLVTGVSLARAQDRETVWVEEEKTFHLDAGELESFEALTYNGSVTIRAATGTRSDIEILAKIRAGAKTTEQAHACLEEVEVVALSRDSLGSVKAQRSRENQPEDWKSAVSFEVMMPSELALSVRTFNGSINAKEMRGPCDLKTHNGSVEVSAGSGELKALTHNGNITASSASPKVFLQSHNGQIQATLAASHVGGDITTSNGNITVRLNESTSTQLRASTSLGRVQCGIALADMQKTDKQLSGRLGSGDGSLVISTSLGNVNLQ